MGVYGCVHPVMDGSSVQSTHFLPDTSNRPHHSLNIELDKWLRKWMNGVKNSFKIYKHIFREYICHLHNLLGNPKLCNLILLTTF